MRVLVRYSTTRRNLELFKRIAAQFKPSHRPFTAYSIYIHRKTGEMCVVDELLDGDKENWKLLTLFISSQTEGGKSPVEVIEKTRKYSEFLISDLKPHAYAILAETIRALGNVVKHIDHGDNLDEQLATELSHLQCQLIVKDQDLLLQLWCSTNRAGAEKILLSMPIGTYLFRKDPYIQDLENKMHEKNCHFVTLTYLAEDRQVVDKTLVERNGEWFEYDDALSFLHKTGYRNLSELLQSFGKTLQRGIEEQ